MKIGTPEYKKRQAALGKAWRIRNIDYVNKKQRDCWAALSKEEKQRRNWNSKLKKVNLTFEEYNNLASKGCKLCREFNNLVIDHDHVTGKFRGILCQKHNIGLGFLGDSIAGLELALQYLKDAE